MDRNEFEAKRDRQQAKIKTIYNYGSGIIFVGVGIFFLNHLRFGFEGQFDPLFAKIFGGILLLYGLFRIWRGYKSNSPS